MKTIIVIASYNAYVPDDMTVSQLQDLVEAKINLQLDAFSVYVSEYPIEDDQCPMFKLQDVLCGTETMVSVGGD